MFWADLGLMRDWSALKNSLQWPVYTINSDDKTNYPIKQTTGVAPHFFYKITPIFIYYKSVNDCIFQGKSTKFPAQRLGNSIWIGNLGFNI